MFTLQILDRGQTFLHALGDRPTVLGSAPDADVRLGEVGVEARHATFTAKPEHVLLESAVPVIVNGRSATQAALMLGDRIELGRAVVLVGHTVPRAAGPEDVLADAVPRERRRPAAPAKRNHTVPLLVGVLGIGVLAFLGDQRRDGDAESLACGRAARTRRVAHREAARGVGGQSG